MERLTERYLEAVDLAWNVYHERLKIEQWAASRGLMPEVTARLKSYLERRGIL